MHQPLQEQDHALIPAAWNGVLYHPRTTKDLQNTLEAAPEISRPADEPRQPL
jgi:hypothetical protein